ncbi:MmyB family transcriptional regulator [Streptomyces massasporeus]|uniref:MmyB family transcriptional regulator n=1 Tax=Streptomyces massasporeus TaxID=67324 RepID=UPI0034086D09
MQAGGARSLPRHRTPPRGRVPRRPGRRVDPRRGRVSGGEERAPLQQVRPGLLRMLRGLHDQPAFVLGRRNEVLASNDLLDALFTPFNHRPPDERNLLRWMLLDPAARSLYLDWAQVTSEVVGVLRAEAGRNPHDPRIAAFVAELRSVSPEFRTWWAERSVVERTWGIKRFDHPVVGCLDITYGALSLPGDPDQVLFGYAGKTDDDLEKLRIPPVGTPSPPLAPPPSARTRTRTRTQSRRNRTRQANKTSARRRSARRTRTMITRCGPLTCGVS